MKNTSLRSASRPGRQNPWRFERDEPKPAAGDPDVERLAHWLDAVFQIPGLRFRFGLDALIGLIPGFGDTLTSLASLYILSAAGRHGVPRITMARMALNIAIDYFLGAIPIVGDVFDVYWKANLKNAALLRRHLATTPLEQRRARRSDRVFVVAVILGLVALLAASVTFTVFALMWIGRLLFSPHG